MDIFPSITHVNPFTAIKRERLLPSPGEVTMRLGQQVSPIQIVARTREQPQFVIINASKLLAVPPDEVVRYLLIEEGQTLAKGTPILRKPTRLGRAKVYKSPTEGILYHIYNGRLVVQPSPQPIEIRAMMHGYIHNLIPHRGVVVEAYGALVQAIWGSGKENIGKLKQGSADGESALTAAAIDKEAHASIIFAGYVAEAVMLDTLEQNSVKGLIVGSMPAALCAAAAGYTFPIIVTDAIGTTGMAKPIFRLLQELEGRDASLFASSNVRDGERPEIIIPLPSDSNPTPLALPGVKLEIGHTVRIARSPFTGQVGKVSRLYQRTKSSAIGLRMSGVDVTLQDGQVVYVPYANLDLLA